MDTAVYNLYEEASVETEEFSENAWQEMRETNTFCDAILETEDGGLFTVHRLVLCLCSPYFRALWKWNMNRKRHRIPGVSSDMLCIIIDFAYNQKDLVNEKNVVDLLEAADQFGVLGLLEDCCDLLTRKLNFRNCMRIRKIAKTYFCADLENTVHRFIMNQFVEISQQSEEFLELPLVKVLELLSSDRINVKNEEQVWEAGLRWIDHDPEERKRHVGAILASVRLGLLDNHYFMTKVKQHEYVENNDSCRQIVIETLRFQFNLERIGEMTDEMETPLLATPRLPNSILFAVGGWSTGSPTGIIEAYDTKADRWIEVHETDPSGPRAYHKLAVIGCDVYVIGGFNGNEYFSSCRCFNVVTKRWRDIAPMHSKRCYVSVAKLDDHIYAMGGFDGFHRQNTAERFDHHANQWTYIRPMNMQRSDACATTHNGLIYICGGFSGVECLPSVEYYDPTFDQWTSIAPMHQRRSGVSAISYHGKIYVIGGFNGIARLASGERYDPETNEWSAMHDMYTHRSNFAIEIMDDLIFAIGGFNGTNTIFHVECYNDQTDEWYEATDMHQMRSALAACVVQDLPNVDDYIHQNRRGLMEEKRQKVLQQRNLELERARLQTGVQALQE